MLIPCVLALLSLGAARGALPKNWKICPKDAADRNECLKDVINAAVQSLVTGNKKLGVLPIDPFSFGRVHTNGNPNGPVALDLTMKDFYLYNLKNLKITDVELNGLQLNMKADLPGELIAKSPYTITGRILTLPLTGDGPSNYTFTDSKIKFNITFKEEPLKVNGNEYYVVEKFIEITDPAKMTVYLGNLFNGNKALGETMNKVLNENWELVWSEMRHSFEDAMSEAFLQLSNRVFSKIPISDINLL